MGECSCVIGWWIDDTLCLLIFFSWKFHATPSPTKTKVLYFETKTDCTRSQLGFLPSFSNQNHYWLHPQRDDPQGSVSLPNTHPKQWRAFWSSRTPLAASKRWEQLRFHLHSRRTRAKERKGEGGAKRENKHTGIVELWVKTAEANQVWFSTVQWGAYWKTKSLWLISALKETLRLWTFSP